MQSYVYEWFAQNSAISVATVFVLFIIIIVITIKIHVRIYSPEVEWRLYRFGKLLRTGKGGMVVKIPLIDHVEFSDDPFRIEDPVPNPK
ncbi:MAG: hypothetical protein ACXAEF_09210 [Candidatus Thorarchaeota archaeon]|jgi:regulator of protease activity HflC (stomatin/prohibitin superfamily)